MADSLKFGSCSSIDACFGDVANRDERARCSFFTHPASSMLLLIGLAVRVSIGLHRDSPHVTYPCLCIHESRRKPFHLLSFDPSHDLVGASSSSFTRSL